MSAIRPGLPLPTPLPGGEAGRARQAQSAFFRAALDHAAPAARPQPTIAAAPKPVVRAAPTVQAAFGEPDPDWWAGLARVRTPVLVVSGGEQSFLPPRHLRTLAAALPDGHFLAIPTGHSVHRDRPDDFAAAALGFLRGEDVGARR